MDYTLGNPYSVVTPEIARMAEMCQKADIGAALLQRL